jgi:hypothetical protein
LALVLGAGGILAILIGGLLLTFYSSQIDLEQKAREHVFSQPKVYLMRSVSFSRRGTTI